MSEHLTNDQKIKVMEIARSITGKTDEILGVYTKMVAAIVIETPPESSEE